MKPHAALDVYKRQAYHCRRFLYLEADDGEKSVNKIIKNEKQSIYKTAGLVYHQEVLGDIRICHRIDYFNCGGIRLQREDGQANGA